MSQPIPPPIQYIPKSLANELADFRIFKIYVCAREAEGVDAAVSAGSPKTNHWTLCCATADDREIVCIDPTPAGPNFTLIAIVTKRDDQYTEHTVQSVPLKIHDLTVGQLIDLIKDNHYDKYQFSSGGQGCRYWLDSIISLLKSSHQVSAEEAKNAWDALQLVLAARGPTGDPILAPSLEQSPVIQGTFSALHQ